MTAGPVKIGVPVLNRGDLLARLIASIDLPAEVLIVVNRIGPIEPSVEEAIDRLEAAPWSEVRVEIERIDGNLGVAGSWNRILARFGGDCWISNSDIAFTPGVLGDAMVQIGARREIVLHHLWAAACFYATDAFTGTLGWFDENFYPAYREDQEMALRSMSLGVPRRIFDLARDRVLHGGSQTVRSATERQRRFIQQANRLGGEYLTARWGELPPEPIRQPKKARPFDRPDAHPADWTLDLEARARITRLCHEITGCECPLRFSRAYGGLG